MEGATKSIRMSLSSADPQHTRHRVAPLSDGEKLQGDSWQFEAQYVILEVNAYLFRAASNALKELCSSLEVSSTAFLALQRRLLQAIMDDFDIEYSTQLLTSIAQATRRGATTKQRL